MTKVFQTNTSKNQGNCLQAVYASLLDLPLNKVPNFIEYNNDWELILRNFLDGYGYEIIKLALNPNFIDINVDEYSLIHDYTGINGYFDASVLSPNYFEEDKLKDKCYTAPKHAVIIDKNFNILHDPNLQYQNIKKYPLTDELGYNGIVEIYLINNR